MHVTDQNEPNTRMKNVIFMIGLMGSGKTTVGTILAQKMGAAFLDTDALIEEREGMKISEIFEKFGESYFRDLETALLERLRNEQKLAGNPSRSDGRSRSDEQRLSNDSKSRAVKAVISVGGGLPVREKNRDLMRTIGTTVLLNANEDTLLQRLMGDDTRPLLRGGDLLERIRTLSRARMALYRDVADLEVQVDDRTPEVIANEVILRLEKTAAAFS